VRSFPLKKKKGRTEGGKWKASKLEAGIVAQL
jgi:hypothetical protein